MFNIRIVTAGAILIATVGAAAAQSDTPSQEPGKPVSLLQMLFKSNNPQPPADAEATGTTDTPVAAETPAHSKIAHQHWHHRRYAHRKSHSAQDDQAAAPPSDAQGDAVQGNAAPSSDANGVRAAGPVAMTFDAPATASLPGTQATASTAVEPSAIVVDGQTVQISAQDEINALDLAADSSPANVPPQPDAMQSNPDAGANPAVGGMAVADDMPAADSKPADSKIADNPVIAFAERDDSDNSRDVWYEDLLATLGCLLAAASAAWFLIGRAPPRRNGGSEQMLVYEIEPMRR
jgi:hypothetical protein